MVLAGGEEGMLLELDQLHQAAIGGGAADPVAGLQEQGAVGGCLGEVDREAARFGSD